MSDLDSPISTEPSAQSVAPPREELEVIIETVPAPVLDRQPLVGGMALVVVAAVAALLSFVPDGAQSALQIVVPISTFAISVLVVVALWWGGWPADRLSRPLAGLVNTALVVAAGFVLTGAGLAVVGQLDIKGMFSTAPDLANGTLTSFPFTFPLAGLVFVAMLQLTLVSEGWPLRRLSRVPAGVAALALSWAVGTAAYYLLINWDVVPAPARELIGLRNPDGPMGGVDLVAWMVCIVMWQVGVYLLLGGWPYNTIRRTATRLVMANVGVIGAGWLTYMLLHEVAGWSSPLIAGSGGALVASVVLLAFIFEGWPFLEEAPGAARLCLVVAAGTVAVALYWGLKALGNGTETWDQYPVELWVGGTALLHIAGVAILFQAVWGRWPLAPPAAPPAADAGPTT